MTPVVLLGPQRFRTTVDSTLRALGVEGPVATVTAGWQEREPDDHELDALLNGRSANLKLYTRALDIAERDPELAGADRARRDLLEELQALYVLRLGHAMEGVEAVQRRRGVRPQVQAAALADAIEAVRTLDIRHAAQVAEVHAEFYAAWSPHVRPAVAEHRAAVADLLGRCDALAVAGGHVGVLVETLHLLNVAAAVRRPVVAWSAGAMALSERVVLFHDRAPHGPGHPQVYDAGLGLCRGVVLLPHARRRLRLDDKARMAVFARRFAPARCVLLDDGVRVDVAPDGACPPGTRLLSAEGTVTTQEAAA